MLITDGNLNLDEFKKVFKDLPWKKTPRWVGKKEESFYIVEVEDDVKKIKISVRPSKRMQISEILKNYTVKGKPAPEGYSGQIVEWGSTVEILVNDKFIDDIDKLSEPAKPSSVVKKLDW